MKLNRNAVKLSQMKYIIDDDYVDASTKECLEMMWDIAMELWFISKKGELSAKSRLQRNVGSLKRA
ncbi:hypothetical protein KAS42_03045 [bacterium]|nr:hypothetical protein [bacterium]